MTTPPGWRSWIRKSLTRIPPYVPGKPVEEVERELGLAGVRKMASNENLLGPSPKALDAARRALDDMEWYPEPDAPALRDRIGTAVGAEPDSILLGNGSDEVLAVLFRAMIDPGDEVVYPTPSFAMYRILATLADAAMIEVPLQNGRYRIDDFTAAITNRTRMLILCSPNNPTGTYLPGAELERALHAVDGRFPVVLDEAYSDFADAGDFPDSVELLRRWPNLAILRTFSKLYGLAGLRIGFGVLEPGLARFLTGVRDPFSVNRPAQYAALAALDDAEHRGKTLDMVGRGREFFYAELGRLGLRFLHSQANFIFVDLDRDAGEFCDLLLHKGYIVRNCASFGLPAGIRITIGPEDWNRGLIAAVESLLA